MSAAVTSRPLPTTGPGTPGMVGKYCDLVIINGDYSWTAHRVVVSALSKFLAGQIPNAQVINGMSVIHMKGGADAPTTDRIFRFCYNLDIDDDDEKLNLHLTDSAFIENLTNVKNSYGIQETTSEPSSSLDDLISFDTSQGPVIPDLEGLYISPGFSFADEKSKALWSNLRLHVAGRFLDIENLVNLAAERFDVNVNDVAHLPGFVDIIRVAVRFASYDIEVDRPCSSLAEECARNIGYLWEDPDFVQLLEHTPVLCMKILHNIAVKHETATNMDEKCFEKSSDALVKYDNLSGSSLQEKDNLTDEVSFYKLKTESYEKDLEKQTATNDYLTEQLKVAKQEAETHSLQVLEMGTKMHDSISDLKDRHTAELNKLAKDHEILKIAEAKLVSENQALQSKVTKLESENDELEDENAMLRSKNDKFRSSSVEDANKIKQLELRQSRTTQVPIDDVVVVTPAISSSPADVPLSPAESQPYGGPLTFLQKMKLGSASAAQAEPPTTTPMPQNHGGTLASTQLSSPRDRQEAAEIRPAALTIPPAGENVRPLAPHLRVVESQGAELKKARQEVMVLKRQLEERKGEILKTNRDLQKSRSDLAAARQSNRAQHPVPNALAASPASNMGRSASRSGTQPQFGSISPNSSSPKEQRSAIVEALRSISLDHRSCNNTDCGVDFPMQFRGITDDGMQNCGKLILKCTECSSEVHRWKV